MEARQRPRWFRAYRMQPALAKDAVQARVLRNERSLERFAGFFSVATRSESTRLGRTTP